mmetsp:Transcript_6036/g.9164  ORF Transcript_6036/g.9164 Transcript_6036/m.9164 type:complete len:201 (-) Transcript_6036:18-620(-)
MGNKLSKRKKYVYEKPQFQQEGEVKILLTGMVGCGKSCIASQYVYNIFYQDYDPGLEDSFRKQVEIDGNIYLFDILDEGETEYRAMRDGYVRTAEVFFLVFSLTNRESYDDCPYHLERLRRIKDEDHPLIMLVGNKLDLEEDRVVTSKEAYEYAAKEGVSYIEVSAKTGSGLEDMFFDMIRMCRDDTYPHMPFQNVKKAR